MDSQFGESFLFLIKLAWNSRITLPVLVTAVFMVMDLRPQIDIDISIRTRRVEEDELENDSNASDDSWETIFETDDEEALD